MQPRTGARLLGLAGASGAAADMSGSNEAGIGEEPEYEEKLDEKPKSVLLSMIRQLKTGMDLSKVK